MGGIRTALSRNFKELIASPEKTTGGRGRNLQWFQRGGIQADLSSQTDLSSTLVFSVSWQPSGRCKENIENSWGRGDVRLLRCILSPRLGIPQAMDI